MLGDVHAQALLDVEVTHPAGTPASRQDRPPHRELAREELPQLGLRRHPDAHLLRRSWELREVCTVYDALYVALAEALDATLVTRDARLARGAGAIVDIITPR